MPLSILSQAVKHRDMNSLEKLQKLCETVGSLGLWGKALPQEHTYQGEEVGVGSDIHRDALATLNLIE